MDNPENNQKIALEMDRPIWDRFFLVHPLVIIGTRDEDGSDNLAPKHMAFPMGWENYFAFVCTPRHSTYHNARREGQFTVSYPYPKSVAFSSLTATKREADDSKPAIKVLPTEKAPNSDCIFLKDAYLQLVCEFNRTVENFGENSLIIGNIKAAFIDEAMLRSESKDDGDLIYQNPILAYISPGRFSVIKKTHTFPFPEEFNY